MTEKQFMNKLNPVYEAIKKTRKNLNASKSLIGFSAAPWTLIYYMFNIKKKVMILLKSKTILFRKYWKN